MLLLISGSLRRGSLNTKLVLEAGRIWGGETIQADLNLPLYNGDYEAESGIPRVTQELADQISGASAVAISTPEYNQSTSGVLQNALDWVSRVEGKPWAKKPVAIMSAAAGRSGGARAQYALRLAMNSAQPQMLTGPEVLVAGAEKEFDENGRLTSEAYIKSLTTLMEKLKCAVE